MMRYSSRGPSNRQSRFGGSNRSGGGRRRGPVPFGFDLNLLVRQASEPEEYTYIPKNSFADFDLPEDLKRNIEARGYTNPTQIQDEAIPALLSGQDVVGLARTGTGKTAAFLLPLIAKVMRDDSQNVLIVAPTRELAVQIDQELRLFVGRMPIYSVVCIGGVSIRPQIDKLRRYPQFVIGTPGRLRDLEEQGALRFSVFNNIVLDEVDQMLDMGFVREVQHITSRLASPRQSLFFSATMPPAAERIAQQFLNNPVRINVKSVDRSETITQDVVRTNGKPKYDVLSDLLAQPDIKKTIVFVRTKRGAEKLSIILDKRGHRNVAIHGNRTQSQRQRAIDLFKKGRPSVLIATDVASRGLDIDDVTHVINFDLPDSYEDYTHRIGRTGRANKTGIALTLIEQ
jgi:superfamily II DNA/RNA helicase